MNSYVHYDPATGEIRQVSVSAVPIVIEGYAVAQFSNVTYWEILDTAKWRVDPGTAQARAGDTPTVELVRIS